MIKKITCFAIAFVSCMIVYGETKDSIANTLLVVDYDYSCLTSNAKGEEMKVSYGITLQVAKDMACTMGQKRHNGENDKSEQLLYVPTTWQNYPQGKITSVEIVPPYQYLTSEKMVETKWALLSEYDTISGMSCQKAIGKYGGRTWIAWFTESIPSRFGPWRFNGLPGLILRAISDDGIHQFECRNVETVKENITYSVPKEITKCDRGKFVKLRNRIFGNSNYVLNPTYYIKPEELESVLVVGGTVILGSAPIDMKPAKFQPLDY